MVCRLHCRACTTYIVLSLANHMLLSPFKTMGSEGHNSVSDGTGSLLVQTLVLPKKQNKTLEVTKSQYAK